MPAIIVTPWEWRWGICLQHHNNWKNVDDSETKREPPNYHHKSSSVKGNFKTQVLARNLMATVFVDTDSFIHIYFFESDTTIKPNILQHSKLWNNDSAEFGRTRKKSCYVTSHSIHNNKGEYHHFTPSAIQPRLCMIQF